MTGDGTRCGLDIDPLGEMWHGYRTMDPDIMEAPQKR